MIILLGPGYKNKANNSEIHRATKINVDTCRLNFNKGYDLISDISCRSCHSEGSKRNVLNLPTMDELSNMDSLKLRDFLFIIKHKKNLAFFKDSPISKLRLKKIDSLSQCDRKNLIHYIKEYSRPHVYILSAPPDSSDFLNKK